MLTATRGAASASVSHQRGARDPGAETRSAPVAWPATVATDAGAPGTSRTTAPPGAAEASAPVGHWCGASLGARARWRRALWLFGGLRDFRWDRDRRWVHVRDTRRRRHADTAPAVDRRPELGRLGRRRPSPPRRDPARRPAVAVATQRRPVSERRRDRTAPIAARTANRGRSGARKRTRWSRARGRRSHPRVRRGRRRHSQDHLRRDAPSKRNAEQRRRRIRLGPPAATARPIRPTSRAAQAGSAALSNRRELESRMREGSRTATARCGPRTWTGWRRCTSPKTYADEDKLKRLTRILRTEPWKAVVGKRVDGAREMGAETRGGGVQLPPGMEGPHGGRLSSQPIFRAEFARTAAAGRCRAAASSDLPSSDRAHRGPRRSPFARTRSAAAWPAALPARRTTPPAAAAERSPAPHRRPGLRPSRLRPPASSGRQPSAGAAVRVAAEPDESVGGQVEAIVPHPEALEHEAHGQQARGLVLAQDHRRWRWRPAPASARQ